MRRTLIVTNDFPPRQGGIQSFVYELAVRQPAGSVVVYASDYAGARAFDEQLPFPVVRHRSGLLVPTPSARRRVVETLRAHDATAVWFGAAAPLGLLAPALRAAGAERIVASTHGHEAGWTAIPGARQLLRRIASDCDVLTYLGEYTRVRLAGAIGRTDQLVQLTPGVDIETFRPDIAGNEVRAAHGLAGRPVVVCVSRLVRRKGQDVLIRAWPAVRAAVPGAALLLVGEGPLRDELVELARRVGVSEDVVLTGAVASDKLPSHYAAGDVFAMPCRTRRRGLDVEGLGIVYLEASAVGLPVLVGRSGGAPDAVRDGQTGVLVDGRDIDAVARQLVRLLQDDELRERMGRAGRAWVEQDWRWDVLAARLGAILQA